jgi:3',5'-cyclic AMP phosphodiesterase CpdA
VGIPEEFVSLGEALRESGFAPERITLVPGNHDLYSSADAWKWAIRGPLSEFEASSATEPGRIIECVGANIMPMDATIHQPVMRSAGFLSDEALDVMDRRASDPGLANKPLIIVQHHPPFLLGTCAWQWIDGLTGSRRLMAMMRAYRHLVVMHGHLHTLVTRAVGDDVPRILGATAVVEDLAMSRVRIFDCRDGQVRCVTSSNESASEPTWSSVGLASFGSVGISES